MNWIPITITIARLSQSFTHVYPSMLQTTCASLSSQESSHTVPQTPAYRTSTRPDLIESPPVNRTAIPAPECSVGVTQLTRCTWIGGYIAT